LADGTGIVVLNHDYVPHLNAVGLALKLSGAGLADEGEKWAMILQGSLVAHICPSLTPLATGQRRHP
jgi:hypothetical protein